MGKQEPQALRFENVSDLSNPSVLSALLDAQQEHRSARVYTDNNKQPVHSTVLGFDYYESSLLVDGFTPALGQGDIRRMSEHPFWIQLKHQDRFLNLYCLIQDSQFDLHTLAILKYQISDNQRWFPRIHFEPRKGPELALDIPFSLPLSGHIRDLSVYGAAIEFYGTDVREQLLGLKGCNCTIRFNDLFEMELATEIKQVRFQRTAPCHSKIRIMFPKHSSVSHIQLENFIDAFSSEYEVPALSSKFKLGNLQAEPAQEFGVIRS